MSINPEWRRRIDHWRNTLPKLFYRPLGTIVYEGHLTFDQLTPTEVRRKSFHRMPEGTAWGAKWQYAWFRTRLTLPSSARGERICLSVDTGGESLILVNGQEAGAKGWSEREVTLTPSARGGETFDILIESYGGHGPMVEGGGPCQHGREMVPEPGPTQVRMGPNSYGIWDEEVFQLWLDTETLLQLRDHVIDKESLRVAEIDDALRDMTLAVDLELPRGEMLKTVRAGRKLLKPLLACRNGSTSPLMTCFGHAHIDVAWLWPLQETERKCGRTFSSQLALMDEYPEYKFLQSQPHLYAMTKRRYPALYARIRKAVKAGQWLADGGMWVEADTNLSGGESLIRQFIHGKRFFKDEFGKDSRLMWLPDVFGYSGAMPQIMAGCGIDYFSTQKIFWTYNGGDPFPYNLFWWEGIDGTRVLSYLHTDYNSTTNPAAILQRWHERVQKDSTHPGRLVPFGYGDGGGGPTRHHLEFLRREKDCEGLPRCQIAAPARYLDAASRKGLPTWVGELYFQAHRGTYTSQAKTKQGNRKSEYALRELELWGAAALSLARYRYPLKKTDALWKEILLCQFHDIIPGSSIHRVYEEAEALYTHVIRTVRQLAEEACATLLRRDREAVTVFNSLSWSRAALVPLPEGFKGALDSQGNALAIQRSGKQLFALARDLPPCGWTTLRRSETAGKAAGPSVAVTPSSLENEHLKVVVNASGEITTLLDKASGRNLAAGPCNQFRLYKDVPGWFDAWDLDSMYKLQPVELAPGADISIGSRGPLFASLKIRRTIHDSPIEQEIILQAGSRRLDFRTRVDWRESHKILKVNFPVTIRAKDALHEIQFGHIQRPTHATQPYDAARFEVCNHKWTALAEEGRGAAILNDCKYGISVEGNSLNLTLLKSALAPDMTADKGLQEFTYAFTCWNGALRESGVVQAAYDLNVPVRCVGGNGGEASLFSVDQSNIIIETVKPAEDGSGDVIVRLYEGMRTATRCRLKTALPFSKAIQTNMLEVGTQALKVSAKGVIPLDFRPFEIKTLRLRHTSA